MNTRTFALAGAVLTAITLTACQAAPAPAPVAAPAVTQEDVAPAPVTPEPTTPAPAPVVTVPAPTPEPVATTEAPIVATRDIQVIALRMTLQNSQDKAMLCDAYVMLGADLTANAINAELVGDDRFPTDVIAEVFTAECGL